jgi:RHS repeat-associated protein
MSMQATKAENLNPPPGLTTLAETRVGAFADLAGESEGASRPVSQHHGGERLFFYGGLESIISYDPIGNRTAATQGTTLYDYDANELNQYTTIDIGGEVDTPAYDDDGNMTGMDGVTYSYNGENRLVAVDDGSTRTEFIYDYMGRRVQKDVFVGGSLEATSAFVYDGWNMVEEIGGTESEYYVWGLDLSQSLQGAGGVGGLIARVDVEANVYYFEFDANGNVGQLVDGSDGSIAARYEYDAFGQTIAADGVQAADNPYRFSTKYTDESGMIYYGYRYYLPGAGRWNRRDPAADGLNWYAFARNDAIDSYDLLGLEWEDLGDHIWQATSDEHLSNLTKKYPGASEKDWVCLWPVGEQVEKIIEVGRLGHVR